MSYLLKKKTMLLYRFVKCLALIRMKKLANGLSFCNQEVSVFFGLHHKTTSFQEAYIYVAVCSVLNFCFNFVLPCSHC